MRITREAAREIGRLISDAMRERGMSAGDVANAATSLLPADAPPDLEVSPRYVGHIRGAPTQPLGRHDSRLKFAACVEALGLDERQMNGLAGGIPISRIESKGPGR